MYVKVQQVCIRDVWGLECWKQSLCGCGAHPTPSPQPRCPGPVVADHS